MKKKDTIIYKGWLTLVKRIARGRLYEVVVHKPAVAAIIMNQMEDKILLVKQFRACCNERRMGDSCRNDGRRW